MDESYGLPAKIAEMQLANCTAEMSRYERLALAGANLEKRIDEANRVYERQTARSPAYFVKQFDAAGRVYEVCNRLTAQSTTYSERRIDAASQDYQRLATQSVAYLGKHIDAASRFCERLTAEQLLPATGFVKETIRTTQIASGPAQATKPIGPLEEEGVIEHKGCYISLERLNEKWKCDVLCDGHMPFYKKVLDTYGQAVSWATGLIEAVSDCEVSW